MNKKFMWNFTLKPMLFYLPLVLLIPKRNFTGVINQPLISFTFLLLVINSASAEILYGGSQFDENLRIGNVSLPPISPGESGVVSIEIENTAGSYLRDIILALSLTRM